MNRKPVCPTSRGRFCAPEDCGLSASLHGHTDQGYVPVFCVETLDRELLVTAGFLQARSCPR